MGNSSRNKPSWILFSVFVWFYYGALFAVFFVIVTIVFLVTAPFDQYRVIANKVFMYMAYAMMYFNPGWEIDFYGMENHKGGKPTIFISNHQSFLDLSLLSLFPWNMKWVAKKSIFYIPVLGWMIKMTGHLSIDRKRKTAIKRLNSLVNPLQNNIPVMIFPEGTRTLDGELLPFRNGAFLLAKEHNFQIRPVVLDGTMDLLPTNSWIYKPRKKVEVHVLDAIDPSDFDSISDLRNAAYDLINHRLQEVRSRSVEEESPVTA
mgnify:CR=1 FL=1